MTFLNWILLGGVAAAVIPIIIHLLHRSQFQVVRWGAMHLLRTSTTRKRRIRIEQLILLAVRAAILALLALCMARPVLTGMQGLLGGAKSSVVVVLDNSLSMNAQEQGRTRLARSREEVAAMLGALPRGSEMFVVWMAGAEPSTIGPSYDPARVAGEINAQHAAGGAADPAAALATAASLLGKAHYANRELVLVSDFQRANWNAEAKSARARGWDLLKKSELPPRITLLPEGRERIDNIAVEAVSVARGIVGVGQRVAVRATIKNHGKAPANGRRVYFRVDGAERSASQVSLGAGESGQVVFHHAFDSAGSHLCEVALDADALQADNMRGVAVTAWEPAPVLLAGDDSGLDPHTGDLAFLEAALQPYRAAGENGGGADLLEVKTASLAASGVPDLAGFRVIIIANAREIPGAWITPLDAFVREGGGLLVIPGDRTRTDSYRRLFQDRTRRFLPAMFGNLKGDPKGNAKPAAIAAERYEHPALGIFNDARSGGLAGAAVTRWFQLQTDRPAPQPVKRNGRSRNAKEEIEFAPEGRLAVLAKLDTGEPFLIEKEYGRGRVIVCATACDDKWGNLPARPFFLPLMQQLVVHLAARGEPSRTLEVGQPIVARASSPVMGTTGENAPATLTDPEGRTHELNARVTDADALLEFGNTWIVGAYRLQSPQVNGETIRFAVNPPARESEPDLLERTEIETLAKDAGARILGSSEEFMKMERRRRFGSELWKPLLALVLALVFLELVLEQRFGRHAR